jgi:hypothetical protein
MGSSQPNLRIRLRALHLKPQHPDQAECWGFKRGPRRWLARDRTRSGNENPKDAKSASGDWKAATVVLRRALGVEGLGAVEVLGEGANRSQTLASRCNC